jgi:hypothetical protein
MQAAIYRLEEKNYQPDFLLQPDDVANNSHQLVKSDSDRGSHRYHHAARDQIVLVSSTN